MSISEYTLIQGKIRAERLEVDTVVEYEGHFLQGKSGDYLVHTENSKYILKAEFFEQYYRPICSSCSVAKPLHIAGD